MECGGPKEETGCSFPSWWKIDRGYVQFLTTDSWNFSAFLFFFLFGKREFSYWEIFYDSRRNIDRSIQRGGFFVSIRLSRQKFVLIVSFISFRFESWGRFSEIPKSTFKLITRNSHELTSRQISRVKRRTLAKRSKFRDHLKFNISARFELEIL